MTTRTALSHDWLNGMRGGEKCLESILRVIPDADIFTLFHKKGAMSELIESRPIKTSYLQKIPGAATRYKHFLPFFPSAIESFDLTGYDLVISTSHCVAKGIKPKGNARHICYCFTPMRYAWLFFDEYFGSYPAPLKILIKAVLARLRKWDRAASSRVTHFIAISHHVRKRIEEFYGREASVIYPPVDVEFYTPRASDAPRGDFYLLVSALVPYKRVELAVEAFAKSGRKLVVIGEGPERKKLEAIAGPTVEFLGWKPNETLRDFYRSCKALIFPGEEDFGIVPLEAQACGAPVVAYAKGGALETVIDGMTGIHFAGETPSALEAAVSRASQIKWDERAIRKHAEKFSRERFEEEFRAAAFDAAEVSR